MIKVPATDGRHPGDRGAHRARRQRQRHAAVLGRPLRAGDRRLPRRSRAARSPPASRSTRSPRWRRSSSRASTPRPTPLLPAGSAAARPRRDRQRPPRLRPLPRALRRRALARAARRRRPPAAAAVGQHRHQGPRLLRRALRRGADRARRRQHDARGDPARVRRPRRRRPHALSVDARRGRRRPCARAETPASTSTRSPRELEREGVRSFCDSYHELLDCIEAKLERTDASKRSRSRAVRRWHGRNRESRPRGRTAQLDKRGPP